MTKELDDVDVTKVGKKPGLEVWRVKVTLISARNYIVL